MEMKRQTNDLAAFAELRERANANPDRPPIGMEPENSPVAGTAKVDPPRDTNKAKRAAPAARKRAAPKTDPKPPAAAAPPKPVYPWEEADPRVPKVFNLRFDEVTWTKLKYLGDTAYNETMHSIAMTAVKAAITAKLRERGITDADAT
ncbi:hypothetical protein [Paraburkholderia youngii]|uniref:hypothetical protein n=1 Tax=Paraburkholderia youngii TaxID=2782701 RepID=UPI00158FE2AE|nr:hypothetical protein [Paraburkholderia youngii]NUX58703.1 hypothetical protein [Paraburkholderia youngii]